MTHNRFGALNNRPWIPVKVTDVTVKTKDAAVQRIKNNNSTM